MNKVVCLPSYLLPRILDPEALYFSMYSVPSSSNVGYVASCLRTYVERAGFRPDANTWDFTTFALSVSAADKAISRTASPNGWTRQINLQLAVHDVSLWQTLKPQLEAMLKFLTGDYWFLEFFVDPKPLPYARKRKEYNADCVALLSGGMDSLVGVINLVNEHHKPLLVSHVVRGNEDIQSCFAKQISPQSGFCHWNEAIKLPSTALGESSTRARSIVFFAFAALAATGLPTFFNQKKDIYVAENGFISLNVSLNPARVSSLSTKTTHPIYMKCLQSIWDQLGLNLRLNTPYKFYTKGEMLVNCKDQELMRNLIGHTVSCGKYAVHKLTHCGRCVPCIVRRAAFMKANISDTTRYVYQSLRNAGHGRHPNDIGAIAMQCVMAGRQDFKARVIGEFAFANHDDRSDFISVYKRGLLEVTEFLESQSII